MALPRMIICLLVLCLPQAICQAANEEKFSTDWITPPLESIAIARDVCAIDLAIRPRGQGWTGTITLYSGQPIYDVFGDADKKLLQATTLPELKRLQLSENVPTKALLHVAMGNPQVEIVAGGTQSCLAKGILRLPVSVTDSDLGELENVRNLHSLHLDGTKLITDEGLAKLASLKLKHLSLMHNGNITDAGVVHLSKIESLESLNLWYCKNLTNRAVEVFKQLPNLRKINLFGTRIDRIFFQTEIPNCMVER